MILLLDLNCSLGQMCDVDQAVSRIGNQRGPFTASSPQHRARKRDMAGYLGRHHPASYVHEPLAHVYQQQCIF